MAITLSQLAQHLERRNWNYRLRQEYNCLVTGVKTQTDRNLAIILSLLEQGKYIEMKIPLLSGVRDNVYKGVIFQTLLTICQETKLVRPAYHPLTGELEVTTEIALEDSELTDAQFDRYLNSLIAIANHLILPRLEQVAKTGTDPIEQQWGENFLSLLEKKAPIGFVEGLERALLDRRQKKDR